MRERHTRPRALLWIVLSLAACEGAKGTAADEALYQRGLLAAERGAYEQALLLRARLSPQSSYYRLAIGEPRFLRAVKIYRVRARSRIEALIGTGQCAAARQALRGALHLIKRWKTMEARVGDCRESVPEPPASVPTTRAVPTSAPSPSEPTTADKPVDFDALGQRCVRAYLGNDYQRAYALGQRYLQRYPKDQKILAVVGAAACRLDHAHVAKATYRRLGPARRNMLKQVCAARKIDLP